MMSSKLQLPAVVAFAAGLSLGLLLSRPGRPDADPAANFAPDHDPARAAKLALAPDADPAARLTLTPDPGTFGEPPDSLLRPLTCRIGDRRTPFAPRSHSRARLVFAYFRVNGTPAHIVYEVVPR
jgi:hypothetical protein